MLPEVVYHYPLADSIEDGHLKEVRFYDYSRVKTDEFVRVDLPTIRPESRHIDGCLDSQ